MKYLLVIILLCLSLTAEETQKKQKVTVGLGPFVQTQPYKNLDPFYVSLSLIKLGNANRKY